ncbi:Hypothetical_protein [Hexamita inflata]|uniref:Hypothetical_protein n=1 Tax=Hexamita inflata TaxID=28002 RepID=A0AA86UV09_9EUKA|nr:Hypothetical protein HINF_LOCUS60480 [Hexamita inflata]
MYLYIQLTLNKCTTDICCQMANFSERLVQGECQSCPELYDNEKQQCTTCQALYGEWSYYLKGSCNCGGGSVSKNTYCDDCWQRRMIVYNNKCVLCSQFDKNAYYEFQNRCACVKNLTFNNFKCHWYSSYQQRVIIISTVLSFALLVSIILFIVFKILSKYYIFSLAHVLNINTLICNDVAEPLHHFLSKITSTRKLRLYWSPFFSDHISFPFQPTINNKKTAAFLSNQYTNASRYHTSNLLTEYKNKEKTSQIRLYIVYTRQEQIIFTI